ncbi:DNA mismatch repair endonuclease MutL [Ichthyenterobacterium sp. W332]|uniref:DNA mismatch repair protein MutL n=1 Tax=Microcosmobacter mediterraneus TaxID=3075607 RepID=A0ABU2YIY5_9FLAO|nr:DNA mismatch repair endonuclease MutL [Ichthyenterobacterium sp. W332]MDT0557200.1 DNA mismatch repair endonuclease MutL [Ichthyenterobacterium sp. W332]
MADIIQLLPDHVANQIAAGEVVQRPASVVKELLENAIDAQSDAITLIIKDAGKTLIQVIDNGIGMSETDARLSFERHATSKIKTAEDLFQLNTKGFRGEALASIAAIAHAELKTKKENAELGVAITIEGSEVKSQEVVVTPKGTSIAVKNLFYNIPARRNFLKSDAVELRHIIDEFHRVALIHYGINFKLIHNGSELFNLPESNQRQRIVNIFGGKTNEKLVPINEDTEVLKLSGFVGKPQFAKKTRSEQFFFVNNRFIKSAYLNHAVNSAFEGLMKDGYHPSYFLNLQVDPKTIDINIHPTKTEIKFDDEHTLYAIMRSAIKHSLGQFNISPVLDFNRDHNLDTPYSYQEKHASTPTVEVDRSYNPFKADVDVASKSRGFHSKTKGAKSWESLYVGLKDDSESTDKINIENEQQVQSLFSESSDISQNQSTFQLQNKYIVSTIKSGLLIIDQYRAHQRILYENLLKSITISEAVSQQLLFPLQLQFSKQELIILKDLKSDLECTGFVFKTFTEDSVEVTGVPMHVSESEVSIVLEQLVSDVEHQIPDHSFSVTDLVAKSLAKSLAIRRGQKLTHEEQDHLINRLFACKEPSVSPTNKATFVMMDASELDKKFI